MFLARKPVPEGCDTLKRQDCCKHTDGRLEFKGDFCIPTRMGSSFPDVEGPMGFPINCAPETWVLDENFPERLDVADSCGKTNFEQNFRNYYDNESERAHWFLTIYIIHKWHV